MIFTVSIATAAAWSYYCPLIWLDRPDTPYTQLWPQNRIVSIFECWEHWPDDKMKTFEFSSHHCYTSSCASEITFQMTWKNNHCERLTNPQSKGSQQCLWVSFLSTPHASKHRNVYAWCRWPDTAMWCCYLSMDGWQLLKHSIEFDQAALLRCVQITRICMWRREFIIVPIERLFAILRKHATGC